MRNFRAEVARGQVQREKIKKEKLIFFVREKMERKKKKKEKKKSRTENSDGDRFENSRGGESLRADATPSTAKFTARQLAGKTGGRGKKKFGKSSNASDTASVTRSS